MDAIDCFGNEGKENEGGGRGGLDLFGRGENSDSATKPENPDLGEEANMDIFVHVPLGVKRIRRGRLKVFHSIQPMQARLEHNKNASNP